MELDTSTLMLIFFILFLTASIWKIWAFLPNEQLKDDDTTDESQEKLLECMLDVIKKAKGELEPSELLLAMQEDEKFDKEKFWRFNLNKLNHLLQTYYTSHEGVSTIKDIYKRRGN